jgi:hypothetical protein
VTGSSGTALDFQWTTRQHIPESGTLIKTVFSKMCKVISLMVMVQGAVPWSRILESDG